MANHLPRDKRWMKLLVCPTFTGLKFSDGLQVFGLLLADTANTVFDFVYLYKSLIIHFGRKLYQSSLIF